MVEEVLDNVNQTLYSLLCYTSEQVGCLQGGLGSLVNTVNLIFLPLTCADLNRKDFFFICGESTTCVPKIRVISVSKYCER